MPALNSNMPLVPATAPGSPIAALSVLTHRSRLPAPLWADGWRVRALPSQVHAYSVER
jgi:hypothetical protein